MPGGHETGAQKYIYSGEESQGQILLDITPRRIPLPMIAMTATLACTGPQTVAQGRNQLSVLGGRASKFPPNNFILQLQ